MDAMTKKREDALNDRMGKLSGSLSNITNTMQVMEKKKNEREKELLDKIKLLESKQPTPPVEHAGAEQDLQALLQQEKKIVQDKDLEIDSLKKKMDDWKVKVKQITTKDLQTIQQLKKQLKDKEDQVAALETQAAQQPAAAPVEAPLSQPITVLYHIDAIESIVLRDQDGSHRLMTIESFNRSLPTEQQPFALPDPLSNMSAELENVKTELNNNKEELRTYKARAHAALKKKGESETRIKQECEVKISQHQEELTRTKDELSDVLVRESQLQQQVQELVDVQDENVKMIQELDALQQQVQTLTESLTFSRESSSRVQSEYEQFKQQQLIQQQETSNNHDTIVHQLNAQNQKEIQVHRDRTRRMMDEKEREIAKLQLKITAMKKDHMAELEQVKLEHDSNIQQVMLVTSPPPPPQLPPPPPQPSPPPQPQPPSPSSQDESTQEMSMLMQLAQEQASRDHELMHYKKNIAQLKAQLQDSQGAAAALQQSQEQLKAQIKHLENLSQHNGGPNMEYLKNVLIKFLNTKDVIAKDKLFKVVSTMLDLTSKEQEVIRQQWQNNDNAGLFSSIFSSKPS
ncbi:hypothetical protein AKO1_000875 [Acrasis kona]|uniref:GRIP domain-containing protein n=1 Tax=Acrasis kona TaxID=1008807 RepID=A0AAW2ZR58_9EUKA